MTFDMVPMHIGVRVGDERFPQIFVFDRVTGACLPAVFLPTFDPLGYPVDQILAVCVYMYGMVSWCVLEADEGGSEFHAVVGRVFCAAAMFACATVMQYDGRPATTSRVAGTGAVGDNVCSVHAVPCARS